MMSNSASCCYKPINYIYIRNLHAEYWKCNPTKVKLIPALYRYPADGSEYVVNVC